jgi:beta-lactam-binding protein with PASTA domain/regulation of enolase protein 1 (concanavalin A-like superfamily)
MRRVVWSVVVLRVRATVAVLLVSGIGAGYGAAQSPAPSTFKLAFYNIQSGKGEPPLAGFPSSFSDTTNCTDTTKPMSAWGVGIVQRELVASIAEDPAVVALGLSEAWPCASVSAVKGVLGWRSASSVRNGVAIVARYGFAGPEQWLQLDTSLNTSPQDTMWVLRLPVCLDDACTRNLVVFTAHWSGSALTHADSHLSAEIQAQQSIDFMSLLPAWQPQVLIGDLNVFAGTKVVCGQNPKNRPLQMMRDAGYLDAWSAIEGLADGSTGMMNRAGCGTPQGALWKRIDYTWSRNVAPLSIARFGMVEAGHEAPSDHAGIIAEFPFPDVLAASVAPTSVIGSPAEGATVSAQTPVSVDAQDDAAVIRVELLLDGSVLDVSRDAPFDFNWNTSITPNGVHTLQAAASDAAGNRTLSALRSVTVQNAVAAGDEIVLHAGEATTIAGNWQLVPDTTAASGARLQNPDAANAKQPYALTNPASRVELSFHAIAGKAYRVWLRARAWSDSTLNDEVYVQFSGTVDINGAPIYRIGTTNGTVVTLEDCDGCGISGWGWQDNGWPRDVLGPVVYFATSGTQRIRIQPRQDGIAIDQIVVSSLDYMNRAPGVLKDDHTILPATTGFRGPDPIETNVSPTVTLTGPAPGATFAEPANVTLSASASDPDDGVARVEFFGDATSVGISTSAPYGVTWSNAPAGPHTITAVATDASGAMTTSAPVVILVVTGDVVVPAVTGLTQPAAATALTAAGLLLGTVTTANSATAASGTVIGQTPAAGTSAPPGTSVALVVSIGPAHVVVPNVVGVVQGAASAAITSAALTLGPLTTVSSATVASGSVISQTPAGGASVPPGTAVALTVSLGPAVVADPTLPAPWLTEDVGFVGVAGAASLAASTGTYSVSGAGADIWGSADAFRYVYQPLTGDGQIIARVASVQNTAAWVKAGVMIRADLTPGAPQGMMMVTPGKGSNFQRRLLAGGTSIGTAGAVVSAPRWVKLTRSGNTITAFESANGTTWSTVGTATIALPATAFIGLAVSSHSATTRATATFQQVSIGPLPAAGDVPVPEVVGRTQTQAASAIAAAALTLGVVTTTSSATVAAGIVLSQSPAGSSSVASGSAVAIVVSSGPVGGPGSPVPSPWLTQDIGTVGLAGSAIFFAGTNTYAVAGAGADIWGTADAFRFVYQPLTGDGQIVTRVASVQNTNAWVKAGVMIRADLTPGSPQAMMMVTPGKNNNFQRRPAASGVSSSTTGAAVKASYWVKLTRSGTTVTAYESADNVTWSTVGTATIALPADVLIGLAVSSHSTSYVATATFDDVAVDLP